MLVLFRVYELFPHKKDYFFFDKHEKIVYGAGIVFLIRCVRSMMASKCQTCNNRKFCKTRVQSCCEQAHRSKQSQILDIFSGDGGSDHDAVEMFPGTWNR